MSSIPRPVFATIPGTPGRLVAVYAKRGKAAYFPMHSVTNAFARAFLMLALPVSYSEGFNPMPRMESTPPLTLGAESDGEVLSVELRDAFVPAALNAVLDAINARLPEGLRILDARMGTPRRSGGKTIGALHAGSDYIAEVPETNADAFGGLLAGIAQRSEAAAGGMVRFAFHADDAHGGPSNPVRMLESIFGEREGLTFCRLRRTGCTGIDGAGNRVALQELL